MALPYVTEAKVEKIARKIVEEQGSSPAPTPSINPMLIIDYTLKELLEYENVDVPVELQDALLSAMSNQVMDFTILTYIEIYTKDGYCFKGTNAPSSGEEAFFTTFCLKCVTSDIIVFLNYSTEFDAETGDSFEILNGISTYKVIKKLNFKINFGYEEEDIETFQYQEGMTWNEYINSSFNGQEDLYLEENGGGYVYTRAAGGYLTLDAEKEQQVPVDDSIIENYIYYYVGLE